jgi:hypothetical protein
MFQSRKDLDIWALANIWIPERNVEQLHFDSVSLGKIFLLIILYLLNDAFSSSVLSPVVGCLMTNEMDRIWKETVVA